MKKTVFAFLFFFLLNYSYGQITSGAALVALDEIEDAASQIITDAENAGNNVINNGAYQLNTLIYNFKESFKETLKETNKMLTQQQYGLFLNIQTTANKLFTQASDFQASLDNTIANLNSVISNIPGVRKKPYISKPILPTFISNDSITDEYEIVFEGSLLNTDTKFKLNEHRIDPSEKSDNRHIYHIDGKRLNKMMNNKRVKMELEIKYGGFLFFKRTAKYKYFAKVVPMQYALVDVEASVSQNDTIRIAREETLPATRTGGSNWRGKRKKNRETFNIGPSKPTNHIVVSSVRLKTLEDRYGYGADIIGKSPAGILIAQHARSEGEPYGGGGKVQSRVYFTELDIIEKTGIHHTNKIPLIFNDPLVIRLPANTLAVQKITLKLYDGKTVTLTTQNTNKNFEVEYRIIDQTLFIKNIVRQ